MAATELIAASQGSGTVQLISGSLVFICLLIAILSQLASGATGEGFRFNWQHVLVRFFAVIMLMQAAGSIQGYIWSAGKSIGDSLLPGPTIAEIHGSLKERIERLQAERQADSASEDGDGSIIDQGLESLKSWIGDFFVYSVESFCVTLIYLNYQWLRSMQSVFMALLAAMAPLILPASIIPGVNTWSSWLKMVISVALWPVIAGFLIKAHVNTMGDFISGGSVLAGNANNLFLNMDTIGLLTQAIFFMLIMFSTPAIAGALVYGSAGVFATGAGLLMSVPTLQHTMGRGARSTAGTARSIGGSSWRFIRAGAAGFGGAAYQAVRSNTRQATKPSMLFNSSLESPLSILPRHINSPETLAIHLVNPLLKSIQRDILFRDIKLQALLDELLPNSIISFRWIPLT